MLTAKYRSSDYEFKTRFSCKKSYMIFSRVFHGGSYWTSHNTMFQIDNIKWLHYLFGHTQWLRILDINCMRYIYMCSLLRATKGGWDHPSKPEGRGYTTYPARVGTTPVNQRGRGLHYLPCQYPSKPEGRGLHYLPCHSPQDLIPSLWCVCSVPKLPARNHSLCLGLRLVWLCTLCLCGNPEMEKTML